jgi:hypothetical protein
VAVNQRPVMGPRGIRFLSFFAYFTTPLMKTIKTFFGGKQNEESKRVY